MSLRQDLLRSKVPPPRHGHAPTGPDADDDLEEELADEARDTFGDSMLAPLGARPHRRSRANGGDYSPLSASSSFSEALEVSVPSTSSLFRVYHTPSRPRDLSALDPRHPDYVDAEDLGDHARGTVFVCHHGFGASGLSWAKFAEDVREQTSGEAGVVAFDVRGHGSTTSANDADFTLSTLTDDLVGLLRTLYPEKDKAPHLVLIGHSLGGAVVSAACGRIQAEVSDVTGLAMLEMVEVEANEAREVSQKILATRPKGFDSKEDAIRWHLQSGFLHNAASARISVPSIIRDTETTPPTTQPTSVLPTPSSNSSTSTAVGAFTAPGADSANPRFIWRTDLASASPFLEEWFHNLSKKFLEAKTAKLLVLAGTDRLNKELTIGQMQGKYQFVVLSNVGHNLHEDAPARTAIVVVEFWRRNERVGDVLKGVKKVGQL